MVTLQTGGRAATRGWGRREPVSQLCQIRTLQFHGHVLFLSVVKHKVFKAGILCASNCMLYNKSNVSNYYVKIRSTIIITIAVISAFPVAHIFLEVIRDLLLGS